MHFSLCTMYQNIHVLYTCRSSSYNVSTFHFWCRDDPVTEFSLKQFSSSKDLKPAISKIVQKGGLSNVGEWITLDHTLKAKEKKSSHGVTELHPVCTSQFQIRSKSELGTVAKLQGWCHSVVFLSKLTKCLRFIQPRDYFSHWFYGLCYR